MLFSFVVLYLLTAYFKSKSVKWAAQTILKAVKAELPKNRGVPLYSLLLISVSREVVLKMKDV